MSKVKRGFTLIELLVVIAIIAILAAILFPVFAQARAAARAISCVSNVKQFSLGILMYAQDYDEVIPRHDNNGSALYGIAPMLQPDWGSPGPYNANVPPAMFANVVFPYIKNQDVGYCPEAGRTRWQAAIPAYGGTTYDVRMEQNGGYYGAFAQMAVNLLMIEWHPQASWAGRPGPITGPVGVMSAWARPAETLMITGDSVWDVSGVATSAAVGNVSVWPYNPAATNCTNYGGPAGWTWYLHKGTQRQGNPLVGAGPRNDAGINSGMANVAFGDGHVKPLKYNNLERCDFNTVANAWTWTFWDPRF
jgi:prepilin-type N-terminal cleavage/methylation domain-containing protein/prepilin-type processing-associated H-X9-DG protein